MKMIATRMRRNAGRRGLAGVLEGIVLAMAIGLPAIGAAAAIGVGVADRVRNVAEATRGRTRLRPTAAVAGLSGLGLGR